MDSKSVLERRSRSLKTRIRNVSVRIGEHQIAVVHSVPYSFSWHFHNNQIKTLKSRNERTQRELDECLEQLALSDS